MKTFKQFLGESPDTADSKWQKVTKGGNVTGWIEVFRVTDGDGRVRWVTIPVVSRTHDGSDEPPPIDDKPVELEFIDDRYPRVGDEVLITTGSKAGFTGKVSKRYDEEGEFCVFVGGEDQDYHERSFRILKKPLSPYQSRKPK